MEYVMTYEDRVYAMLKELDGTFVIADKVSPENTDRFVATVKRYIHDEYYRCHHDVGYRVTIEFNNEYTKIRKIKNGK